MVATKTFEITTEVVDEQPTVVADATLRVEAIGPWVRKVFGMIAAAVGSDIAGPPFARYRMLGDEEFEVEAGFPVAGPVQVVGELRDSSLPGGTAAVTMHVGPYDQLGQAYEALSAWVSEHGGTPTGAPWECYLSEPDVPPERTMTRVVQPYRPA